MKTVDRRRKKNTKESCPLQSLQLDFFDGGQQRIRMQDNSFKYSQILEKIQSQNHSTTGMNPDKPAFTSSCVISELSSIEQSIQMGRK